MEMISMSIQIQKAKVRMTKLPPKGKQMQGKMAIGGSPKPDDCRAVAARQK